MVWAAGGNGTASRGQAQMGTKADWQFCNCFFIWPVSLGQYAEPCAFALSCTACEASLEVGQAEATLQK